MSRQPCRIAWGLIVAAALAGSGCGRARDTADMNELQRVKTGPMTVVLLSSHDALRQGTDTFIIEFRTEDGDRLVDVGEIGGTASMAMTGTPMFGSLDVRRTNVPGRYEARAEFSMAGTWRIALEWEGPAGKGAVAFAGSVL